MPRSTAKKIVMNHIWKPRSGIGMTGDIISHDVTAARSLQRLELGNTCITDS